MASDDRFYRLEFRHRPVLYGDIGSLLKIDGLLIAGGGARALLLLPSSDGHADLVAILRGENIFQPTAEEWSDFLRRSDVPEILVGPAKAFQRKAQYEISGLVQQRVWIADGLRCMYCQRKMGEVQLTIDHFVPLELGGKNNETNYLSACRQCNKNKGSEDPGDWCRRKGLDHDGLLQYLATRRV